ncbi:hypothetical protein [Terrabacter aerolatus]|uniref:hypothetical protein n=1 Tax=Terrabacter aerolatus TaxID=422442 RepID=UPI0011BE1075|nr:hypothetical protein [Terrabacter aerolatus]
MGWIDIIEAAPELLPRRWKSRVGTVLIIGFWLIPSTARELMAWYVQEKAQELLAILIPLLQQSPHGF